MCMLTSEDVHCPVLTFSPTIHRIPLRCALHRFLFGVENPVDCKYVSGSQDALANPNPNPNPNPNRSVARRTL